MLLDGSRWPDCVADPVMLSTYGQDAFVESVVKAGEYQNTSEAVRDALRVLQQRRREMR